MHVPTPVDHARHDLDLIAAHVAGDLPTSERTRADALLQACSSCADLRRDLIALAAATRALPRTAAAPRDFRLSAAQAARLRRGSWLRTLLRPFASPRSATRPMAAAFTSLGLAGLLVASIVPGFIGGQAAAPGPAALPAAGQSRDLTKDQAEATSAAEWAPGSTQFKVRADAGGPGSSGDDLLAAAGRTSPVPTIDRLQALAARSEAPVAAPPGQPNDATFTNALDGGWAGTPVLLGSLVLLLLGLALFGLRFAARRVR